METGDRKTGRVPRMSPLLAASLRYGVDAVDRDGASVTDIEREAERRVWEALRRTKSETGGEPDH